MRAAPNLEGSKRRPSSLVRIALTSDSVQLTVVMVLESLWDRSGRSELGAVRRALRKFVAVASMSI